MNIPSLQGKVSQSEWDLRVDLAACYRLVSLYGMSDLLATHISARIADSPDHFLINPYGLLFEEITASSLIKVDAECNVLSDSVYPVNPAGFIIHSAIHSARHDAACVLHTHTRCGAAVSAQRCGLLPISQQATILMPSLAYHDYEGVAVRPGEKVRLQQDLGDRQYLILRNHGLLTVGSSVGEAFHTMYLLENACRIQVDAQSGGGELVMVDPAVNATAVASFRAGTGRHPSHSTWEALRRKLDRIDASYAT